MIKSLLPDLIQNNQNDVSLPEQVIDAIEGATMICVERNGQRLYCVRDWVYWISHSRSKDKTFAWANLKRTIRTQNDPFGILNEIHRLHVPTNGGKQFMDFASSDILTKLKSIYLDHRQLRKVIRISNKRDEILCMHPEVKAVLESNGWSTNHHVRLLSGHIIDFIAFKNNCILAIECKPEFSGQEFYSAIGQVICYAAEYDKDAHPTIATYSQRLTAYIVQMCKMNRVMLITLPEGPNLDLNQA
jgi:Holliday junction resolvase